MIYALMSKESAQNGPRARALVLTHAAQRAADQAARFLTVCAPIEARSRLLRGNTQLERNTNG